MNDIKGIRTVVLNQGSPEELRDKVLHYFHQTFNIEDKLYESIAHDAGFYLRADPLRHPIVFYLGHTAVFYINKLNIARIISKRINPEYESMFAVGVDEMSWDDLNDSNYNWPSIAEVRAYRAEVRALVDELIKTLPLPKNGITWDSPWWAIMMGIEHQRIHLETSSVLIRQLPLSEVQQLEFWDICHESGAAPKNELLNVKGGQIKLGKESNDPLYGWDNEYGTKQVEVGDFKASRYLVSNQEFLGFVKAGGYQRKEYWTEEGWAWRNYQNTEHPHFWLKDEDGSWLLRTIASVIPMPWNHPVEVNYLEAKAFCNWKALLDAKPIRLPTEAEWYCLRDAYVKTDQPYWEKAPGNINLEYYASACPVDKFGFGEFFDLIGNVWQWTESHMAAFQGFKVHPYYDDFSVPTFDNRHNMIKGGSFISTGNEALRNARYAFRRHFFQHAGFRYVESENPVTIESSLYEDDPEILPWCALDWESSPWGENFHAALLEKLYVYFKDIKRDSALSFGCKTGRSAFELAKHFSHVTGLDATTRLIRLATQMKEEGYIRYYRIEEGEVFSTAEKSLAELGLHDYASRCEFWQADSANIPSKFTGYDLILAENVLERSGNPRNFLEVASERLNPQGMLIIVDAYDWKDEFTIPENRLGGFRKDGEPQRSFEGLSAILSNRFTMLTPPFDLLQGLPTNARNWNMKKVQVSVWKLK
ncbi:MAG: 5-histidylcysteine sulfoxide synthase [Candidatus Cloacimonetes bacterium]|nr:5-histidylcysteine sulfoxide synthase [Candidatus Cloacimonadota bacterium]